MCGEFIGKPGVGPHTTSENHAEFVAVRAPAVEGLSLCVLECPIRISVACSIGDEITIWGPGRATFVKPCHEPLKECRPPNVIHEVPIASTFDGSEHRSREDVYVALGNDRLSERTTRQQARVVWRRLQVAGCRASPL